MATPADTFVVQRALIVAALATFAADLAALRAGSYATLSAAVDTAIAAGIVKGDLPHRDLRLDGIFTRVDSNGFCAVDDALARLTRNGWL